jgi:hypothetical protein
MVDRGRNTSGHLAGRANRRPQRRSGFVTGNLQAGDRVVALGAHLLREGEHVRLAQTEAPLSVAVNA